MSEGASMQKLRLPDFIIGGAPRCGTSWLYHLLDLHPGIYMAKPLKPEPKFFLIDEVYNNGIEYYAQTWFADVPEGMTAGEKSTNYLESAAAAARLHEHMPKVKLVFILREPVGRAFSNYQWSVMNGLEQEDFSTALSLEKKRQETLPEKLRYARPWSYFSRGLYAELLEAYFRLFSREQMLILRYEDIRQNPEGLSVRLHRFLGVSPRPADSRGLGVINAAKTENNKRAVMQPEVRKALHEAYAGPNRKLAELLGKDFHLWEGEGE